MSILSGSKLIAVLSAFTRSEWRDFRPFVVSGVAGPKGKSLELYDYLSGAWPEFADPVLFKSNVFTALFGDQPFDDKKLRYALTDLYRQAGSFLKYRALAEHREEGNYLLMNALAQRRADKAYLALYQSDEVSGSGDASGHAEGYFHRYRKEFVHLNYYLPRQKRNELNPIGEVARNLDIFFIARKLQLLCEIINVRNVLSVQYEFLLREKIMELVRDGVFNDIPVIIIYYRILMTLTQPEAEEHFETLKTLLNEHGNKFKKEELRDMYQYLMNYCIKQINQGVGKYINVLFVIYKTILENRVIYTGSNLSQWDFKNIVVTGIRADEQEWVLRFIEQCKDDLPATERENAYVYNLAYYYFSAGDFRRTLSLLQRVEFTDLYYQLDMRAILLKCYFEMDDQEAFFYHVAAFRIFLSRNKLVSDYQRTIYRNMIKFTTAMVRAGDNRKKLSGLRQEIEEVKQVADLNWLRKKVAVAFS